METSETSLLMLLLLLTLNCVYATLATLDAAIATATVTTACAYIYIIVLHVCDYTRDYVLNLCANGACFSRFTARSIFSVWFNFFFSLSGFFVLCRANSRHSLAFHAIEISVRMWEQLEYALENAVYTYVYMNGCMFRLANGFTLIQTKTQTYMHTHQWNIDDIHRKRAHNAQWPDVHSIFFSSVPFLSISRPDDDDDVDDYDDHEWCVVCRTLECEKYRWPFHRRIQIVSDEDKFNQSGCLIHTMPYTSECQ